MKIKKIKLLIILTIMIIPVLCGCDKQEVTKENNTKEEQVEYDDSFVKNQLLLVFNDEINTDEVKTIIKKLNATIDEESNLSSMNMYTLTFKNKEFKTREEIKDYCNNLTSKYKQIISCSPNNIYSID